MRAGFELVKPTRATTFGSAAWMAARDLRRPYICERGNGPFLGFYAHMGGKGLELIRVFGNEPGHLLTVAPTRSGKGRCHIVPNLLSWPHSAVVLDVKGENYDLTAGWRARELGQKVVRFAPFAPGGARWNPLDWIVALRTRPEAEADLHDAVTFLVELMFTPPASQGARDPFWQNTAKAVVRGIVLHVVTATALAPADGESHLVRARTLAEVRRLLTLPPDAFQKLVVTMGGNKHPSVRECAQVIVTTKDSQRQWVGVLTEAIDQTAIWSYKRVADATATSDFSFAKAREDTTVYLCIPPEHLNQYRAMLRVLTGCAMRELKESWSGDRDQPPVLMVLDEFPQLHHMQPIEDALAYIAGYGVKLWFFVQDLGQFEQHYPKTWRSFVANCGVRAFFGVSDYETAKLVSDMTGQSTVHNETRGVSESRSQSKAYSESESHAETVSESRGGSSGGANWSSGTSSTDTRTTGVTDTYGVTVGSNLSVTHVGRPLATPDEVMRLNAFEQIIFLKGEPPIRAWMLPYDKSKQLVLRLLPVPLLGQTAGAKPPPRRTPEKVAEPVRNPADLEI
jgi:type IV secretion system protein VirD4